MNCRIGDCCYSCKFPPFFSVCFIHYFFSSSNLAIHWQNQVSMITETLSIPMYVSVFLCWLTFGNASHKLCYALVALLEKNLGGKKTRRRRCQSRKVYFEIQIVCFFLHPCSLFCFLHFRFLCYSPIPLFLSIVLIICDSRSIASSDIYCHLSSQRPTLFSLCLQLAPL